MKTIMLATDFSERSDRAMRRATLLARKFGAQLSIVHVVDDDQPRRIVESERAAATALLTELRNTVQSVDGLACDTRVVLADPFEGIARAAGEKAADILVIGPHRRQALRDVFVGTTAERTIRSAACPVLMVNAPPVGSYAQVMLTSDLSQGAQRAVTACKALGIARGADAAILHIYDAQITHMAMSHTLRSEDRAAYLADQHEEAARSLATFVEAIGWPSLRRIVRDGRQAPAQEILTAAKEEGADLIVVGTHGRSGIANFFLGSVAEAVLRGADQDVLAVPPAAAS